MLERLLVLELSHHFIGFGIQLDFVLVVFDLLRRARQDGAQEVLVDEQVEVGVDVLLQMEAPR